jgi:hypothetical protein
MPLEKRYVACFKCEEVKDFLGKILIKDNELLWLSGCNLHFFLSNESRVNFESIKQLKTALNNIRPFWLYRPKKNSLQIFEVIFDENKTIHEIREI